MTKASENLVYCCWVASGKVPINRAGIWYGAHEAIEYEWNPVLNAKHNKELEQALKPRIRRVVNFLIVECSRTSISITLPVRDDTALEIKQKALVLLAKALTEQNQRKA